MREVRIILADDHTIVRKGLRVLLEEAGFINVIAEADDGHQLLEMVADQRPDAVVMDISMPHLSGLEATRRIKANYPAIKVVILTMHLDEEYVLQSLHAGAHGYVVKQSAPKDLVHAIEQALKDQVYISAQMGTHDLDELVRRSQRVALRDRYETLTGREREILQLIAEGNDVGQIAVMLYISEKTVRAHRSHLMDKLGLHNPTALIRYALQRGIISFDS
ncbi:MAG: response regulator transcription factor [Chloroflexota bacterium]|jgi:DNA-binding NarL/FixJ family response regulator